MSEPHRAVLPLLLRDGVLITRLIVGPEIQIIEVVSSATRLTVIMNISGRILVVRITNYPILMVVHLSV